MGTAKIIGKIGTVMYRSKASSGVENFTAQ